MRKREKEKEKKGNFCFLSFHAANLGSRHVVRRHPSLTRYFALLFRDRSMSACVYWVFWEKGQGFRTVFGGSLCFSMFILFFVFLT